MTRQNKAYLFAILAVFCWSTVASAFKLTLRHVDFLTMLLWSSAVSTVFLFVTLVLQGKAGLLRDTLCVSTHGASERRPRFLTEGKARRSQAFSAYRFPSAPLLTRPLFRSAANGFLNPFLYYVILFKAYSLLPAQEAQPLNFTWPIVLVFLSAPMLGQKIKPLSIFALAVSFLGVLIVSTHGNLLGFRFTNLPGAILATGSAIVWALFWLTNVRDERDEVLKLLLNFLFGFIYVLALTLILDWVRLRGAGGAAASFSAAAAPEHAARVLEGVRYATTSVPGTVAPATIPVAAIPFAAVAVPGGMPGLLGCVYIGIFEMGAAFVLWLKALQLSEATAKVSNLIFLSPFISLIFIRFVVGEKILPSSIVGLGFIAAGILIQRTATRQKT